MSNHESLSSKNGDNSQEIYDSHENEAEQQKELKRKRINDIYSSVLTLISFQERKIPGTKEPLVAPYYEKALRTQKQAEQAAKKEALTTGAPMKKIEKIPGENPKDRKNFAYLERLDSAIERGGSKLEKKLWQESIKNFAPMIEKEDINNSTWVKLKEAFDNDRKGQGLPPAEYTESEMDKDYERLRQNQVDSINSWTEYLSNEETPFPTWFKVYAFDGVIKMGSYNQEDSKYEKRDKSTVAPYPKVSPAALALTLDAVNDFFGQDKEKWFAEHTGDDQLNAVVKSGNFGKIYTHFFNETYKPIPTPERTEDIEGEWFDFFPGQEAKLAEASQGTPWCIASEHMGMHYLKTNENIPDNKARFRLFKLENESSVDGMSKTACASIRFNPQGEVEEVSGLKAGQGIDDSLIPIVEQEILKYPLSPDKHFEEKFRDKKELIRLQEKAKNGEELTLDEYAFLYEKDRKIFILDTYRGQDPKIAELRNIYNISKLLQSNDKDTMDQDLLIQKLECILENAGSSDIAFNINTLLKKGFDINFIFNKLGSDGISQNLNTLLEQDIDINFIFNKLNSSDISRNLNTLLEKDIDIHTIFNKLNSYDISENFEVLSNNNNIPQNLIIQRMDLDGIKSHLENLQSDSSNIRSLQSAIYCNKLIDNCVDIFQENGSIDLNTLFDRTLDNQLDSMTKSGSLELDMNELIKEDPSDILKAFLEQHPVDFSSIKPELYSRMISNLIDYYKDYEPAKLNDDRVIKTLVGPDLIYNLDNLLQIMPIDRIVANMRPADIETYHDELIAHGASL